MPEPGIPAHDSLVKIIKAHPFFEGLAPDFCTVLCGCAKNVRFAPDTYLLREGEQADQLYLIRHGLVALEMHAPGRPRFTFQTVGPGEIVGVSWLVPPYRWSYDARAIDDVRAIGLNARCLRRKCDEDHDLGYAMMQRFVPLLVQRLQATRLQLMDIYGAHD